MLVIDFELCRSDGGEVIVLSFFDVEVVTTQFLPSAS